MKSIISIITILILTLSTLYLYKDSEFKETITKESNRTYIKEKSNTIRNRVDSSIKDIPIREIKREDISGDKISLDKVKVGGNLNIDKSKKSNSETDIDSNVNSNKSVEESSQNIKKGLALDEVRPMITEVKSESLRLFTESKQEIKSQVSTVSKRVKEMGKLSESIRGDLIKTKESSIKLKGEIDILSTSLKGMLERTKSNLQSLLEKRIYLLSKSVNRKIDINDENISSIREDLNSTQIEFKETLYRVKETLYKDLYNIERDINVTIDSVNDYLISKIKLNRSLITETNRKIEEDIDNLLLDLNRTHNSLLSLIEKSDIKIDKLYRDINGTIDDLDSKCNNKIDTLNSNFNNRYNSILTKLSDLKGILNIEIENLKSQIDIEINKIEKAIDEKDEEVKLLIDKEIANFNLLIDREISDLNSTILNSIADMDREMNRLSIDFTNRLYSVVNETESRFVELNSTITNRYNLLLHSLNSYQDTTNNRLSNIDSSIYTINRVTDDLNSTLDLTDRNVNINSKQIEKIIGDIYILRNDLLNLRDRLNSVESNLTMRVDTISNSLSIVIGRVDTIIFRLDTIETIVNRIQELNMEYNRTLDDYNSRLTMLEREVTIKSNLYGSKIADTQIRVQNLESVNANIQNQINLSNSLELGRIVFQVPDIENGIYPIDGSSYEDSGLADYLRSHPIRGFTVNGSIVKTPDWRGRFLVGKGAMKIRDVNGELVFQSIQRHHHKYIKAADSVIRSGSIAGGYYFAHYGEAESYTDFKGEDYTRPYSIAMGLCIVGSKRLIVDVPIEESNSTIIENTNIKFVDINSIIDQSEQIIKQPYILLEENGQIIVTKIDALRDLSDNQLVEINNAINSIDDSVNLNRTLIDRNFNYIISNSSKIDKLSATTIKKESIVGRLALFLTECPENWVPLNGSDISNTPLEEILNSDKTPDYENLFIRITSKDIGSVRRSSILEDILFKQSHLDLIGAGEEGQNYILQIVNYPSAFTINSLDPDAVNLNLCIYKGE